MILVSFGTPCPLSYSIDVIVKEVANYLLRDTYNIYAGNVDGLKNAWNAVDRELYKNITVYSDLPTQGMLDIFANSKAPILLATDEFSSIVRYIVTSRGISFRNSVRFCSQAMVMFHQARKLPNIFIFSNSEYGLPLKEIVAKITRHYGIDCYEDDLKNIHQILMPNSNDEVTLSDFSRYRFPPKLNESNGSTAFIELMPEDNQLNELLSDYDRLATTSTRDQVTWPVEMFLRDDTTLSTAAQIELVGPARCFIHGPYLCLPAGRWKLVCRIEVDQCKSINEVVVDIYTDKIVNQGFTRLPPLGVYEFDLDFENIDAFFPIQVRFYLRHGAIEGAFKLVSVTLLPI